MMRCASLRVGGAATRARSGIAMVAVVLVLMALFILSAPFLLTVRNADKASTRVADRASARIALDAATRHARLVLGGSHAGLDETPYSDSLDEVFVSNRFRAGFLDANDARGVMWDLEARDLASVIDLNSAPPQVLANLTGGVGHLRAELAADDTAMGLYGANGFDPQGLVWVAGELVGYSTNEGGQLGGLARSLQVVVDADGQPYPCGPQPATDRDLGLLVLDERAVSVARWRTGGGEELRRFTSVDEVSAASTELLDQLRIPTDSAWSAYTVFLRTGAVLGDVTAGPTWQHGARLVGRVQGGPASGCRIELEDARWFNPGTTIRIRDGQTTELGVVRTAGRNGIVLMQPLVNDYEAYTAVVEPLARRPVNVNTARPEVLRALVLNLRLRGKSSRISTSKAEQLVDVIVESRPFDGFEDFVRRVVLPSAGLDELPADAPLVPAVFAPSDAALDGGSGSGVAGFLTQDDAIALYKNALNANDGELAFSTMPFAFTTRDVYALDVRAAVNAASGAARVSAHRESVELIVPQRPLLRVWGTQEDFDLALRLERQARGWVSGPEPTTRYDAAFQSDPPSRARAHLGPYDTAPSVDPFAEDATYSFASRTEEGWVQLATDRVDETDSVVAQRQGKVLHFDDERDDPEGRYLPDGTVPLPPDGRVVDWIDENGLMRPLSFSMWVRPRALEEGMHLLDLGARFPDADRVSLLFEGSDLVLRVRDGAGDHPDTGLVEVGEARYALASPGPGLPLDTWSHVMVDVRGNRPDQLTLMVDGRYNARNPGLTRLTSALNSASNLILVESTEGFPDDPCVLRIGNELIEALKTGPTSFLAQFATTGRQAGFGGRQAREVFSGIDPGVSLATLNTSKDLDHAVGAAVSLYGYSLPLQSNAPPAEGSLTDPIGKFQVGRVTGIVKGGDRQGPQMEPITITTGTLTVTPGYGMDGQGDDVEGLILEPVDTAGDLSDAFQRGGGYALLVGPSVTITNSQVGGGSANMDSNGMRLGGMEVIHYTSWDGTHLEFDRRGDAVPELQRLPGTNTAIRPRLEGRGSWVFDWTNVTVNGQPPNDLLSWTAKVIPISVGVRDAGGNLGFLVPAPDESEFAQLTPRSPNDAHLTEWVRYDEIAGGQLVRTDPQALFDAFFGAQAGTLDTTGDQAPGGTGPPPTGQTNVVLSLPPPAPPRLGPEAVGAALRAAAPQGQNAFWLPLLGESENEDLFVSRSVASALQFRGVLGTYSHAHTPGTTTVLPVWHVEDGDVTFGWPGRFDHVTLMDFDDGSLGFHSEVQRAHRPNQYTRHEYVEMQGAPLTAAAGSSVAVSQDPFLLGRIYLALSRALTGAVPAGGTGSGESPYEPRRWGRVVKFPSGERPRVVRSMSVGGSFQGGQVPAALVDEVVFGTTEFGELDSSESTHGAQLYLERALGLGETDVDLVDNAVRTTRDWGSTRARFLSRLAPDAGICRIGEELVCYEAFDEGSFRLTLAPGGRGLLGSEAENHSQGEAVTFLNSIRVTTLAGGIGAQDDTLQVADVEGFPERGLVLIDQELVHYSWLNGQALGMPVGSLVPGTMDREGGGVFRGRFGTEPAGHASGTPVILMPFRYADLWSERVDVPELSFYGFSMTQPGALWQSSFFDVENSGAFGPRLGVLQRSDPRVSWDADPERTERLEVYWDGLSGGDGNPISDQSDRIEWRVFVRHEPGSYDPLDGLSHGWKTTPRLRFLGVEYLGPGRVLSRIER